MDSGAPRAEDAMTGMSAPSAPLTRLVSTLISRLEERGGIGSAAPSTELRAAICKAF